MKNTLLILAVLVFSLSLSSCTKNKSETITGKWKVTESEFAGNKLIGDFNSAWYRFNEDGTFEKSAEGKTQAGTWSIDEEKSLLTLEFDEEDEESKVLKVTLSEFSDNKIKMDWEEFTMEYSETLVPAE
ncbi:lipocalin family protein [Cytophagaceae bacterium ABcell3]|nr:lipocalin family protein [Cytophagaceae bacterium ABcell3]